MRLANDRVAAAVFPQMPAGRHVPDDKKVTSGPLRCSVQQLMHSATINDYLGLSAHIFLKFGDFLGSVADEFLLPLGKNIGALQGRKSPRCR